MASWAKVSVVVLLAVQAYTCVAVNNQETGWLTKHLKRPRDLETHRSRHLGETTEKEIEKTLTSGWRATLIHPTFKQGTDNFTILQKIHQDVQISKERAKNFNRRVSNTPYNHNTKGRKLRDFVSDVQVTPGSYSMEISIGTPPQDFIAIADTGSDLVWLQCSTCDLCFDSKRFDPSVSSTYAPIGCGTACDSLGSNQLLCSPNCQYTYLYGDQSSTQGDFSLDTITLNSTTGVSTEVPEFQFGCGLKNNGSFSGTDGLVGLARGPISFPSQIAPYLNGSNKFSYCLLSRYDNDTERSPLIFGEAAVPTSLNVNYTKLLTPYEPSVIPYYYVSMLDITIGSSPLSIPDSAFALDEATGNGGVIFDSGTTYTILNTEAYEMVKTGFESFLDSRYNKADTSELSGLEVCYDISGLDSVEYPAMILHFADADMELEFENTMILFSVTGDDLYMCLALLESDGLNIIGSFQQQNYQVLYDENNLQIGWATADCKTL